MHAGLKRQDADADKISQKRLDCTIAYVFFVDVVHCNSATAFAFA